MQKRGLDYLIIIKLHPIYNSDQKQYKRFFESDNNIQIVNDSGSDYKAQLYRSIDLHISIYSATIFESLCLGVPTAVLGIKGYKTNSELIDQGDVFLIKSPDDLMKLLKQKSSLNEKKNRTEYFYAKDSLIRMRELIKESLP